MLTAVLVFPPPRPEMPARGLQRAPDSSYQAGGEGCRPDRLADLPPNGADRQRCAEAEHQEQQSRERLDQGNRAADAVEQTARTGHYQAWIGFWQAIGMAGAFGAASIAAVYARRAAGQTKRAADEADKAFKMASDAFVATHRPRIHLRRAFNVSLVDERIPVTLEIANRGESGAVIKEIGVDLFARYLDGRRYAFQLLPSLRPEMAPPGKSVLMNLFGGSILSNEDRAAIKDGQAKLCLIALINYEDLNGLGRSAGVFRLFDPEKRRFFRPAEDDELAEWDYED